MNGHNTNISANIKHSCIGWDEMQKRKKVLFIFIFSQSKDLIKRKNEKVVFKA
jgi:hypothetical protein